MLTHPRQELYRLGILYHDKDSAQEESESVRIEVPSYPVFFLRASKPRQHAHRSTTRRTQPLYLSMSDLSRDADIARLFSPSSTQTQTIQHRDTTMTPSIPQSLPPTSALESTHGSHHLLNNTVSNSSLSFDFINSGDWTLIGTAPQTPLVSTPSSEPETWILLSDDS